MDNRYLLKIRSQHFRNRNASAAASPSPAVSVPVPKVDRRSPEQIKADAKAKRAAEEASALARSLTQEFIDQEAAAIARYRAMVAVVAGTPVATTPTPSSDAVTPVTTA